MKKIEENRFPHSATLFKFCREALAIRYDGNVKVIDQDVGAILGYDPADCSHWKKGKKNIRALGTLRSIADHLNIDERLLIDIAGGKVGLEEAVYEFKGYGNFAIEGQPLDQLKKEFFRNPSRWQSDGTARSFDELFNIDRKALAQMVDAILDLSNITEAPVYLPEIVKLYPDMQIIQDDQAGAPISVAWEGEGTQQKVVIRMGSGEMRPYMRFLIAKELFNFLYRTKNPIATRFLSAPSELVDVLSNVFAGMLLAPSRLLRKEVEQIDSSMDVVSQLADIFWVSKALMNQRLRDYLEHFE